MIARVKKKILKKIRRFLNQLHRYDFLAENHGWTKIGNAPVWGNRNTGTMFDPYVWHDGSKFRMVVSDRSRKCLQLVESDDGILWSNPRDILHGRDRMWDSDVNRGCLIQRCGKWYLWYTGQQEGVSKIGLAVSDDGVSFERVQDTPVLSADLPQEGVSVMNPCVLWDESENRFRMWFSAGEDYEPDVIFHAYSDDGIKWSKLQQPVLEKCPDHMWERFKVGGCNVIKDADGHYEMYYIGYQNLDVARICIAHSDDGILWNRDDDNLLLAPSKNAWDSDAVYKPSVVKLAGKVYLWYNGRCQRNEFIGAAIKELNDDE